MAQSAEDKNEFYQDLCKALIKSNIPLNVVENRELRDFLKKYTGKEISHESTRRKNYADSLYEQVSAINNASSTATK